MSDPRAASINYSLYQPEVVELPPQLARIPSRAAYPPPPYQPSATHGIAGQRAASVNARPSHSALDMHSNPQSSVWLSSGSARERASGSRHLPRTPQQPALTSMRPTHQPTHIQPPAYGSSQHSPSHAHAHAQANATGNSRSVAPLLTRANQPSSSVHASATHISDVTLDDIAMPRERARTHSGALPRSATNDGIAVSPSAPARPPLPRPAHLTTTPMSPSGTHVSRASRVGPPRPSAPPSRGARSSSISPQPPARPPPPRVAYSPHSPPPQQEAQDATPSVIPAAISPSSIDVVVPASELIPSTHTPVERLASPHASQSGSALAELLQSLSPEDVENNPFFDEELFEVQATPLPLASLSPMQACSQPNVSQSVPSLTQPAATNAAPAIRQPSKVEEEDSQLCIICMDERRDVVLVPCGHMILCQSCSDSTKPTSCPICRATVVHRQHVFVA